MSYSARIMNLPHSSGLVSQRPAAEIAGEADATIADLVAALEKLLDMDIAYRRGPVVQEAVETARAALARAKGQA